MFDAFRQLRILSPTTLLLFLMTGILCFAASKDDDAKVVRIPPGRTISGDYFAAGDIVEISGTIDGDLYVAGGEVIINGKVTGDILGAAGKMSITGDILQDARIAGGEVLILGRIDRNLTAAAGQLELREPASVQGGIVAAAGEAILAAPVGSYGKIAAGNATVSSRIGGNLEIAAEQIKLTPGAIIAGDFTYWSRGPALIDKDARISGRVSGQVSRKPPVTFAGILFTLKIVSFVSTLIIGLLFLRLFPKHSRSIAMTLKERPWASLGIGFITLISVPVTFGILLITVVGIPLAFILLALYFIALYLVRIFVALWAGMTVFDRLGKDPTRIYKAFIAGLVIYFLITLIPIAGGLVSILVQTVGLGAALLTEKRAYEAARTASRV